MCNISGFIKKYQKYYFKKIPVGNEIVFAKRLCAVDKNVENYIVNEKLKKGVFDIEAFAWKAGRIKEYVGNHVKYNSECFTDEKYDYYINGIGTHIDKNEFQSYVDQLNKFLEEQYGTQTIFDQADRSLWDAKKLNDINWENEYIKIAGELLKKKGNGGSRLSGFGPVNIINTMFFVSKGKAPLYDQFAHRAAKALAFNMNPIDVSMRNNPDKTDVKNVMIMYKEYIYLINKLFHNQIGEGGMYIPRDIDRALWVYGHTDELYEE